MGTERGERRAETAEDEGREEEKARGIWERKGGEGIVLLPRRFTDLGFCPDVTWKIIGNSAIELFLSPLGTRCHRTLRRRRH